MHQPQNNNDAVVVLILSIVGFTVCQLCSPIAWYLGNQYLERCRQGGYQPDQMGVIGRILGIVGTALLALVLVFLVAYFVIIAVFVVAA